MHTVRTSSRAPSCRRAGPVTVLPACVLLAAAAAASLAPAAPQGPGPAAPVGVSELVARADEEVKAGRIFDAITTLGKAAEAAPDRADIRLRLAGLMKQRGMWIRSAEQYRAVLGADPGNIQARIGYGELLLAEYQFRPAAEEFQRVLDAKAEPMQRDRSLVGLGNAQFGLGAYRDALDTYRILLARKPDEPTALAFSSIALRKIGDLDAAIAGWRRFLARQPDVASVKIHLMEAEEFRADIVRQKAAAASEPRNAAAQARLGDLLRERPDMDGAVAAYRAAVNLTPDPRYRFKLAVSLREAERYGEAATEFRALATDGVFGALASQNLAYCARRVGDGALEAAAWRMALEASPRDTYAFRRYLEALFRAGGTGIQEEAAFLAKAAKERPNDPLPRTQYAALARFMGLEDEAMLALLEALTLEPNDPYAQADLRAALTRQPEAAGKILDEIRKLEPTTDPGVTALRKAAVLMSAGRPKEAEPLLAQLTLARPADARAAVALVLCHRAMGAPAEQLVEELRRARDLDPGYIYGRLDLARTLLALSRFEEAAAEAETALGIAPDNVHALMIAGSSLRSAGGTANLERAYVALRRAVEVDPMDTSGAARFLLSKVAWEIGKEEEARAALKGELPTEPEEMYRLAWEFVRDNYVDRTFNGQDWNRWRDPFAGKLETVPDALGAIARMLASLDNRDTRLRSADQTINFFFTPRSTRVQRDAIGRTAVGSRTVATSTLEGNVGYVTVSNMTDPKLIGDVKEALSGMKEHEAVILDLRGNPGGAQRDVEQVTSMLVPPGSPTGSIVTPSGTLPTASRSDEPPIIPDKPVVVLVDRNTGSSAEALAGALKESRRVIIVGEPTYGKAGIQVPRLLPGGTTVLVATAETADIAGKAYTGVGVVPDVAVEGAMPAGEPGEDAAIAKAKEILIKLRDRRGPPKKAPAP